MKIVFARNFRGFKSVSLPVDRNLFFVGDNSSGKSSLLHLLNVVFKDDLAGRPGLDSDFHVHRDDFFSPYFDYADVDLGFVYSTEKTKVARIITLKRGRGDLPFVVSRITFANGEKSLSLKYDRAGKRVRARLRAHNELPDEESLIKLHSDVRGFQLLELEPDGPLNEFRMLFESISRLVPDTSEIKDFTSLLFAHPLPEARHIGPIRGAPESFYAFEREIKPTGGHFAALFSDMLRTKKDIMDSAIKSFGSESGLFEDLTVERVKSKFDNSPLFVTVKKNGRWFTLSQVGIGVSQVAPIIAEMVAAEKGIIPAKHFLIQQPELHLHPRAQAAFGEFTFIAAQNGISFYYETHSDFLIDRYRANVRENAAQSDAAIIYCVNEPTGNSAHRIDIREDGSLDNPPTGYLDFFLSELNRTIQ